MVNVVEMLTFFKDASVAVAACTTTTATGGVNVALDAACMKKVIDVAKDLVKFFPEFERRYFGGDIDNWVARARAGQLTGKDVHRILVAIEQDLKKAFKCSGKNKSMKKKVLCHFLDQIDGDVSTTKLTKNKFTESRRKQYEAVRNEGLKRKGAKKHLGPPSGKRQRKM